MNSQKLSTLSVIMMWGAFILLFSVCTARIVPQNSAEDQSKSKNSTAAETPPNPTFVAEGEGGNPGGVPSSSNSTASSKDNKRTEKQSYYNPYPVGLGLGLTPSQAAAEGYYNPFPNYYPSRLGGVTGPGNRASSCAYAYPNRRYSCLGLGRRR